MNNPWDKIDVPVSDVHARRVDPKHSEDFFWARDHSGGYLFIFRSKPKQKMPDRYPALTGIAVDSTPEPGSGRHRLILFLRERSDWELFLALCQDLVAATKVDGITEAAVPSVILRRLTRWRDFLSTERVGLLSEQEIKGLIGELIFLSTHLADHQGIGSAVKSWEGPNDSPQDFCVGNTAIEVKCQLGTTTSRIAISSEQQLFSQLPFSYLYVVTLGKTEHTPEALNLLDMVAEIRERVSIEAPDMLEYFNDLVYETGYRDDERYRNFSYLLVGQKMYEIEGEFPRLRPDSIPCGVERVRYNLDLSVCEPFIGTPDWVNLDV
ncbi:PD-(D/E)XK motif protein [Microbulbifer elongatus]|uniref:PD-(D/E)XK motif protein n=1 Tax=Microbulbifer elongatus TaxID=86173 RepID=A0ABT1NX36_9GAMM|nr:PD-(D/E)XK motif protein [Microbulbifer elongatus]MCQ3828460.1 PD-(D/E)XK motif protein [Microbulbifer elongatus]